MRKVFKILFPLLIFVIMVAGYFCYYTPLSSFEDVNIPISKTRLIGHKGGGTDFLPYAKCQENTLESAKIGLENPVSYTHLTLPTKRRV